MSDLFDNLPAFLPPVSDAELYCLSGITAQPPGEWDMLDWEEWEIARKLERRGLIKISRCAGELWAQRTRESKLRLAS